MNSLDKVISLLVDVVNELDEYASDVSDQQTRTRVIELRDKADDVLKAVHQRVADMERE